MHNILKQAVNTTQRAQRNYDLSKSIPQADLDTLIYAATKSPSKQNETHYSLYVFTDKNHIANIYKNTKHHAVFRQQDVKAVFKEEHGKFWQDEKYCVTNSQILANAVFVFVDDDGPAYGGTHMLAQQNLKNKDSESRELYVEQKNYSIGIAVGELLLTAGILGYKTGCCSAFSKQEMQNVLGLPKLPKLIVGVGFPNQHMDRRDHPEVLNRDLPEEYRNGDPNAHWKFVTHEKNIKTFVNYNVYGNKE